MLWLWVSAPKSVSSALHSFTQNDIAQSQGQASSVLKSMVVDRVIRYRAPQGNELSTYSQQTLPTRGNMRWPCFLSLIKVYLSMKRKRSRKEIHLPSLPSFLFLTPQVLKFIYSFVALKETNSIEKEDKRFSPFQLLLCV